MPNCGKLGVASVNQAAEVVCLLFSFFFLFFIHSLYFLIKKNWRDDTIRVHYMPPAPREEEKKEREKKVDQARNELPRRDSKRSRWKRISKAS